MGSLKELSSRIKNIKSVQKATKMMQIVSAAKLTQSQNKLSHSKLYVSKLHSIILSMRNQKKIFRDDSSKAELYLIFVIASDRGLCGNFNSSIVRLSKSHIKDIVSHGKKVDIIFLGKKAFESSKSSFNSENIIRVVESSKNATLKNVATILSDMDLNKYGIIQVLYNKFYSVFSQKPMLETIRPWNSNSSLVDNSLVCSSYHDYEYEPKNTKLIFKYLVHNYTTAALYSALLESIASENSARMIAMDSATRNTNEMIKDLELLYNRSRQAAITTDLVEIIAGAESL